MAKLDLEPIMAKLCHPTRGLGWTSERAIFSIEQYRRWLWLHLAHPGESFSPSRDVDQVWHMHILDTRKYADDCQIMFGTFLHHNPYAGWESTDAEAEHQEKYRRTQDLFARYFGEKFVGDTGLCMTGYCDDDISSAPMWRPTMADICPRVIC